MNAPFSYNSATKETVPCNFCGSKDLHELATRDHEGLDVRTCVCKRCGLIFINPRMTKEWYGKYYAEGEYRTKIALRGDGGKDLDREKLDRVFNMRTAVGEALGKRFRSYFKKGLIIDVGSGVGGTLDGIRKVVNVDVLGIEPSLEETQYANKRGIKTIPSLIEDIQKGKEKIPLASTILSTQSLNHFLDPKRFLMWAYNQLKEGGALILEVKNFIHQAKKAGGLENAIQIDHTYMFTPGVFRNFIESAGFDVIFFERDDDRTFRELAHRKKLIKGTPSTHMRLVAIKSERKPFDNLFIDSSNYTKILHSLNKLYLYSYGLIYNKVIRKFL